MDLHYKITLSDQQIETLTEEEKTFVNLFNVFRWAFRPGRVEDHPINIFRNFKNPKGHNLIEEMENIKKHLTALLPKRPGSVWRGLDWSKSFQNWLIRTEPRIKAEDLKSEIVPSKKNNSLDNNPAENKIDRLLERCRNNDFIVSDEERKRYLSHLTYLRSDFDRRALDIKANWFFYYSFDFNLMDYMEELLRLRIQDVCSQEKDIEKFISWVYCIILEATIAGGNQLDLLIYFFAEYLTGKKVVTINHTKESTILDLYKEENKIVEELNQTENDYIKIQFNPEKVYSLRDIRGLIK